MKHVALHLEQERTKVTVNLQPAIGLSFPMWSPWRKMHEDIDVDGQVVCTTTVLYVVSSYQISNNEICVGETFSL